MKRIQDFVSALEREHPFNDCINPYLKAGQSGRQRRANLSTYLKAMYTLAPSVLLIGEAPGHRGCGRTGIPFVCEKTLSETPFFKKESFILPKQAIPIKEATAQAVWRSLAEWDALPLLWNIFPFHPHKPGLQKSNRPPRKEELQFGKQVLLDLLDIFPIERILAVGKKPESQLTDISIPFEYIRHPSFGGKRDFETGMHRYQKNL